MNKANSKSLGKKLGIQNTQSYKNTLNAISNQKNINKSPENYNTNKKISKKY